MRTRILLACLVVALVPLTIFALGTRSEVGERLRGQYEERVAGTAGVVRQDLARHAQLLDSRLRALARRINSDAGVRAALLHGVADATVSGYAAAVMTATGLDYLLLLDADGTVLSSGHFRGDYGRSAPHLPPLTGAAGPALISARRPQGNFLALARAHEFTLGGTEFVLVGGVEVDAVFVRNLARDSDGDLTVTLAFPGGTLHSRSDPHVEQAGDVIAEEVPLPFLDDVAGTNGAGQAQWRIAHSLLPLQRLQRRMELRLLATVILALALALLIARLLAARVTRPLEELARKATRVNLERPDVDFTTTRYDEVGTLSRTLDAMVQRLRSSAQQLREAERRATVGDMARQVNHDIRNGLLPIRNVIRHLADVAQRSPDELGSVFAERQNTLHGGINYLESLATNYARLTPRTAREVCDVNAIVRAAVEDAAPDSGRIQLDLASSAPRVAADPVALRRVVENLTRNALESLHDGGTIRVSSARHGTPPDGRVSIVVSDTGGGIAPEALEHIFDDFFTTKERGTGLGLSIVRRLVADMGGRVRVESEPGRGSTFRVELPEVT